MTETANQKDRYVPALAYRWLTPLYDPVIRLTTRERTFKSALLNQAEIEPGMRVLDLGCGTGTLAIWTKQHHPEAQVDGLDGDPEVLERARAKAERSSAEVSFAEGMSTELPYRDQSFDRVLSSLFFHHLNRPDKQRTLAEVSRVLRPAGQMHIADWGRPRDPVMKALSYSIRLLDGEEPTRANLRGELPGLIEDAGFRLVEEVDSYRTVYGSMALIRAQFER